MERDKPHYFNRNHRDTNRDPSRRRRNQIRLISRRMRVPIPRPKQLPSKPTKSYRKLKPGQLLVLKNGSTFTLGTRKISSTELWFVKGVDSQGAKLVSLCPNPTRTKWYMQRPNWEEHFSRARKPNPKELPEYEWYSELLKEMK